MQSLTSGRIDWRVEEGLLVVRLSRPLSPQYSLRLAIAGRRLEAIAPQGLSLGEMEMVRFRGARRDRRLVALAARPPGRLELQQGERLTRVDPRLLEPGDLALFEQRPTGMVFVGSPRSGRPGSA